jgi:hypothetical protein
MGNLWWVWKNVEGERQTSFFLLSRCRSKPNLALAVRMEKFGAKTGERDIDIHDIYRVKRQYIYVQNHFVSRV